jgi:radical SAM-linked protein
MNNINYRYQVTFTKEEQVRFLSHLDMMRLIERVLRRSELPLAFSQGFCPKLKLSLAWPLSVGMTGAKEFADFQLTAWVKPDLIAPLLNHVAPVGCSFQDAQAVPLKQAALTTQVTAARWRLEVPTSIDLEQVYQALKENLKELDYNKSFADLLHDQQKTVSSTILDITLPAGPAKNIRLQKILPLEVKIHRSELILY